MHVMKFNRGGMKRIMSHVNRERETVTESNIDWNRTSQNVSLCPTITSHRIREIESMAKRKDAVLLVDTVLTLPEELKYSSRNKQTAFFRCGMEAIHNHMGGELAFAVVHYDETTPHLHLGTIPLVDGRLNAKQYVNRTKLKGLHPAVEQAVKQKGYDVSLYEVDEEQQLALHASGGSERSMHEYRQHMVVEGMREQYESEVQATIEAHQQALKHDKRSVKKQKGETREEYKARKKDYVEIRRDEYDLLKSFRYDTKVVKDTAEARRKLKEAEEREQAIKNELKQAEALKGQMQGRIAELDRQKLAFEAEIERRAKNKASQWYNELESELTEKYQSGINELLSDLIKSGNKSYVERYLAKYPVIAGIQSIIPQTKNHHHNRGIDR